MTNRALIVMARHPTPGETKTRLCPPLTPDDAARLYERFLLETLRIARSVPGIARFVAYTPAGRIDYFRGLAPDFAPLPQQGDGLGERLDEALCAVLARGFDGVVVLGSDVPTLPPAHVAVAFDLLGQNDIVLGPCEDGGYYLLGVKRPQPGLLREVRMSTPTVLADTLTLAAQEGLRVGLAPSWYDVDTVEDLRRMEADLAASRGGHRYDGNDSDVKDMDGALQFRIAQGRLSDLGDILRVERQSFGIDAYPKAEFVWLRRLGRETFLVARKGSRVIGYIAAFVTEGNGYIASMAVATRYRRQGIGAALMAAVRERFSARGVAALTLHVRAANEQAVRLYERQGFVVEARVPGYYEDGALALYMKLPL